MNEEGRKPDEKQSDAETADSSQLISRAPSIAGDQKNGTKSANQRTDSASLKNISLLMIPELEICTRRSAFKKWFCRITVAEMGMFLLTATIATAGIYYTIYAKRQWRVMSGQLIEMQKSTTATKNAAQAATSAAMTANATLIASQRQFRLEERPWVLTYTQTAGDNPIEMHPMPDGRSVFIDIRFLIGNIGKTPATNLVTSYCEQFVGPKAVVQIRVKNYVPHYHGFPGQSMPPTPNQSLELMNVLPIQDRFRVSPAEFEKINAGTWEFYMVGGIKYTDIFQPQIEPYETIFCYQYNPTGLPISGCGFLSRVK